MAGRAGRRCNPSSSTARGLGMMSFFNDFLVFRSLTCKVMLSLRRSRSIPLRSKKDEERAVISGADCVGTSIALSSSIQGYLSISYPFNAVS